MWFVGSSGAQSVNGAEAPLCLYRKVHGSGSKYRPVQKILPIPIQAGTKDRGKRIHNCVDETMANINQIFCRIRHCSIDEIGEMFPMFLAKTHS